MKAVQAENAPDDDNVASIFHILRWAYEKTQKRERDQNRRWSDSCIDGDVGMNA